MESIDGLHQWLMDYGTLNRDCHYACQEAIHGIRTIEFHEKYGKWIFDRNGIANQIEMWLDAANEMVGYTIRMLKRYQWLEQKRTAKVLETANQIREITESSIRHVIDALQSEADHPTRIIIALIPEIKPKLEQAMKVFERHSNHPFISSNHTLN